MYQTDSTGCSHQTNANILKKPKEQCSDPGVLACPYNEDISLCFKYVLTDYVTDYPKPSNVEPIFTCKVFEQLDKCYINSLLLLLSLHSYISDSLLI